MPRLTATRCMRRRPLGGALLIGAVIMFAPAMVHAHFILMDAGFMDVARHLGLPAEARTLR